MHIINFITAVVCFFLLMFSLHLLFAKQGNRLLNCLLAVILLSRFAQIIVYLPITSFQMSVTPFFYKMAAPIFFAAPGCIYLYLTGLMNNRSSLKRFEWLHFIPVILAIIDIFPWNFSFEINSHLLTEKITEGQLFFTREKIGLLPSYFYYPGRPVLMVGYLIAFWHAFLTLPLVSKNKLSNITKTWILFFLKSVTLLQLLTILHQITIFHPIITDIEYGVSNLWFITLNCLTFLVAILFILHKPQLLYGHLLVAVDWKKNIVVSKCSVPPTAFSNVNISPQELELYKEIITKYMVSEKPYLLPGFQIIHLAQKLDIPVHQCSLIINIGMDKNFRDWINSYRILHFISQYPIKIDRITIESIANESGFKNATTFYNAFKKTTGLMPTTYFLNK